MSKDNKTHAQRITRSAGHSGVFNDGVSRKAKAPSLDEQESSLSVDCVCGTTYSLHVHTVCPKCYRWPKSERQVPDEHR